jgi:hypothetical protein
MPDYGLIGPNNLPPPYPTLNSYQTPCQVRDPTSGGGFVDEVHSTFLSSEPGSASRVLMPIILPANPTGAMSGIVSDYYDSMVLTGDNASAFQQSLAQVFFLPQSTFGYLVVVSVISLYSNVSSCNGLYLTWNDTLGCESELLSKGNGTTLGVVNGSVPIDVTFVGMAHSTSPLTIFVNDSSDNLTAQLQLNKTTTGVGPLSPDFSAACDTYCVNNWTFPFGLAFGADLCYYGTCDSFQESTFNQTNPVTMDPPLYWTNGSYSGQYWAVGLQSASGDCAGSFASGYVLQCPTLLTTGYYPFFSFNGSQLNFGTQKAWATENFHGPKSQFEGFGTMTNFTTSWLDQFSNDSQDGFIAPSASLNVSIRAQVLGTVSSVALSYHLPSGSSGNLTMTRTVGNSTNGTYVATIPSSGGNGLITYRIWSHDAAGAYVADPAPYLPTFYVVRGPIPLFHLAITLNHPNCGAVVLNGTAYATDANVTLPAGYYSLAGKLCYPFVFGYWLTSPGVTSGVSQFGTLGLAANGSLKAFWTYVRPIDSVQVRANPSACASSILINGTEYTPPALVQLPDYGNYSLTQSPCNSLYEFSGWLVSNSANLSVMGYNITVRGNGTLTATYIPSSSAIGILFETVPAGCNGILFRGTGVVNGETIDVLPNVAYPIHQDPCLHYGFSNFTTSNLGVTISAGNLTATQAGTVTEWDYHLTEVTILTQPFFCGGLLWDNTTFYANGALLNITNNTVHSVFPSACAGYYVAGMSVSGALALRGNSLVVNGSGTLVVASQKGTPHLWVGFQTNPTNCGSIIFSGSKYHDTNWTNWTSSPNGVSVSAIACSGWGFVTWQTSGGITIVNNIAYVNESGSIEAVFHPLAILYVFTTPSACGSVTLNGATYTNGATVYVPLFDAQMLTATPCHGYGFSAWHNESTAILTSKTLTLIGSADLTAVFTPMRYSVTFLVNPSTCGGVTLNHQEFFNNSSTLLEDGQYPVSAHACPGDLVLGWNSTGGVTVNASTLTLVVNGPGAVLLSFGPVPPTLTIGGPPSSYAQTPIRFEATVPVLVPPYDYNYTWTFGDGHSLTTPANYTTYSYSLPGVYHVQVVVRDPLGREASANMTVTITAAPALQGFSFSVLDAIILGLVAVVVVGFLLLARRPPALPAGEAPPSIGPAPEAEAVEGPQPTALPSEDIEDSDLALEAPSGEHSNSEDSV